MNISSFEKALEQLSAGNAKNFDPVRFAYLQSLAKRLENPLYLENSVLVEKAFASVDQYRNDFESYRRRARPILDQISVDFEPYFEAAKALFEECRFRQLERLSSRLRRQRLNQQNLLELRDLVRDINQPSEASGDELLQLSIDDILRQQEQNALIAAGDLPVDNVDGSGEQLVMQSMKHFRQSMQHFNIDKIIARAINEGPDNPGPLNPQMLAIKSLTHMRDLSPSYLRRFANYIETLLWLEKNAAKLSSGNNS